jgi:branched-subunit amino acid transport protein
MTAVWLTIAGLCVGTVAIKSAGPLVLGGRRLPERAGAVVALLAPALLAALVVYESLNRDGRGLELDSRLIGLAAAAAALALKRSTIVVVIVAAAATALARAVA